MVPRNASRLTAQRECASTVRLVIADNAITMARLIEPISNGDIESPIAITVQLDFIRGLCALQVHVDWRHEETELTAMQLGIDDLIHLARLLVDDIDPANGETFCRTLIDAHEGMGFRLSPKWNVYFAFG
ncbi:hypothetical protein WM08_00005 [Burkholderia ubonensis]|nr:hypothetical protein WL78_17850 [Burkholderia ubonensis]KWI63642.1 hypothetical protein WM07_20785 [Burkholderia ubonensis]KWI92718.1 hypothetical protein WM08_00005 [Burkholderia ubonensis]